MIEGNVGAQGSQVVPGFEAKHPEEVVRVQELGYVPLWEGRMLGRRMASYKGVTCSWPPQQSSELAKLGFQLHRLSISVPTVLELTSPQQMLIDRWKPEDRCPLPG